MYGETEISGRIISIFMRFVVLIGKGIAFVFWSILLLILFGLYLILPPLVVLFFITSLFGYDSTVIL